MRICSLVPGATEVVVMLGFAEALVGISHECDYPEEVRRVPVMVQPVVDSDGIGSAEIDHQVKALMSSGRSLYRVDERALAEARPDIILAQAVCDVCAVTPNDLEHTMRSLPYRPHVLTLAPRSLAYVIDAPGAFERTATRSISSMSALKRWWRVAMPLFRNATASRFSCLKRCASTS